MDIIKSKISKIKDKFTKTDLERKLKEATSNEHCHANVSLLDEISQKTSNYSDFQVIVNHCLKKLECRKEKWRRILKTLFLIEHILKTGTLNFVDSMKSDLYKLKNLKSFSFIDTNRSDKGETIREKSKVIVALLEDKQKLLEEREKYSKWKGRIEGVSNNGRMGGVSSSSYNNNNNYSDYGQSSSYLDRGNEKKISTRDESSDSSSSDDKKKKKKEKKEKESKKVKKESSSSSEDEKPKKEVKKKVEEESESGKKKVVATSNISIKKPGQTTTNTAKTNTNTAFNPFEMDNTPSVNKTSNNNDAFNDIFGPSVTSSTTKQTSTNSGTNQLNDIFSTGASTNTTNTGTGGFNFDFTSVNTTNQQGSGPNTMNNITNNMGNLNIKSSPEKTQQVKAPIDTQKLLNNMYNPQPQPQQGFPNNQFFGNFNNNFGGMPGMQMNNMNYMNNMNGMNNMNNMHMNMNFMNSNQTNPQFNQNFNNQMYPNMNLNNTNTNNNMYGQKSFGNTMNNMPNLSKPVNNNNFNFTMPVNNSNDDEFREVEEENTFKVVNNNQNKGGLSSLLDPKLVNLNDLKGNSKSNNYSNNTKPSGNSYNFNY